MTTKSAPVGRRLIAIGTAVVLAFGASRAVASPPGAEPADRCERDSCDRACKRTRPDLVGVCVNNLCQCLQPVPQ